MRELRTIFFPTICIKALRIIVKYSVIRLIINQRHEEITFRSHVLEDEINRESGLDA